MVLSAVAPRARKSLFLNVEVVNVCKEEVSPSAFGSITALTAQLESQKTLDAASDAVVMRLRDSGATRLVSKFDEPLVVNRANEIGVHVASPSAWYRHQGDKRAQPDPLSPA
jgi:hypothetical protein